MTLSIPVGGLRVPMGADAALLSITRDQKCSKSDAETSAGPFGNGSCKPYDRTQNRVSQAARPRFIGRRAVSLKRTYCAACERRAKGAQRPSDADSV